MEKEDNKNNDSNFKYKITLKLNKYKYFPLEEIQGSIIIHQNKQKETGKITDCSEIGFGLLEKIAHIYDTNYMKILKIEDQIIPYNLKGFDTSKDIVIPIKYKLPELKNQFYPSFRYYSPICKCIISHTLTAEIPFLSNKSRINIFIKKPEKKDNKNNEEYKFVFGDESVKFLFKNVGKLSYYVKVKKSNPYKDKIPVEIHLDTNVLRNLIIESINLKIKKRIYLLDYDGNNNGEIFEKDYDMKKMIIKNLDNDVIKESLQLPEEEFVPITIKEIHKPSILEGGNYNFSPPVRTSLFVCEYIVIVYFIFKNKLIQNKSVRIPIDLYDNDNDDKKSNEMDLDKNEIILDDDDKGISSINEFNDDFYENDELFRDFERESVRKKNDESKSKINNNINNIDVSSSNKEIDGFIVYSNEDFVKFFETKKNK